MDRQQNDENVKNTYSRYSHSEETDRADFPPAPQQEKSNETKGLVESLEKIFGNGKDPDKFLIIALMFLLYKEGADIKLIIALGYIFL
ncbi:MAG: hypothetical protein IJM19_01160 [Ruminococcus sp.]|nr:hypothetical protein [Ruminococcus sp.]MBR6386004.1 hypothetical protein [Ruminococcus sp.]